MKLLIASLMLLPAATAEMTFAAYKERWNRVYETVEEEAQRAEIFAMNVESLLEQKAGLTETQGRCVCARARRMVAWGDSAPQTTATRLTGVILITRSRSVLGVTKFFDQTPEEFKRSHLNYRPVAPINMAPVRNTSHLLTGRKPRSIVNWADAGATTPVKDQGYCGSCWAFSAVEQIESAWFLAGNDLTEFSTQQMVSCDTVDAGCNGGDSPSAYEYVEGSGGLTTEAAYPYTSTSGTTGSCESFTPVGGAVKGYEYVSTPCTSRTCTGDEDMLKTGLDGAPASICVNAATWNSYTGGVMDSATCGKNGYYNLDHCVQLVGYNVDASTPYWIVRNSWAGDWGEGGMIYLTMGENTCGVADEAMTVTF